MTERKGRFGFKGLVATVMIGGAVVLGGCAQTLYTFEGDKKIWDFVSENISENVVPQSIRDKQKVEGRGGYQYDSNNNQKQDWSLFAYNEWVDLNNDDMVEMKEFIGKGKRVFNLKKEEMHIAIMPENYIGEINIKFLDYEGNIVGDTKVYAKRNSIVRFPIMPTTSSGNYKLSATLENGETKFLDFTIIN